MGAGEPHPHPHARAGHRETTLSVSLEGGKLVVHRRPDWTSTLSPEYADAFDSPHLGLIRFHRTSSGPVTELSVRQPRVYDMRFRRNGEVKSPQARSR